MRLFLFGVSMSFFIAWAAKTTPINFLGIIVNVPTHFMESGYIAMDVDGSVWAYTSEPSMQNSFWHCPDSGLSEEEVRGILVLEINSYATAIPELGEEDYIGEGIWTKTLVKLSDCPIIKLD